MRKAQKLRNEFTKLKPSDEWKWIIENKKEIWNITFAPEGILIFLNYDPEAEFVLCPSNEIPDCDGFRDILYALGFALEDA